jgi:hypothetical protein
MVMLRTENVGGGGHWILDFGAISAKIFFATFSPIAFFPSFSQQSSSPHYRQSDLPAIFSSSPSRSKGEGGAIDFDRSTSSHIILLVSAEDC